jgi:hypothetical protein
MAYDSFRGVTVLFGGIGSPPQGDTWEYGDHNPPPPTGACCDLSIGECTEDVEEAACGGALREWSEAAACTSVECSAATGACCDVEAFGTCTDGTTAAVCDCATCVWSPLGTCAEVDCQHASIPSVSEWGIAILGLLLLIGAKIRFARRVAVL